MKLWCKQQVIDAENQILCAAYLAEARAFPCPYQNNEERQKAEYPCSDYKEMGGNET